jgi:hypothetical protein
MAVKDHTTSVANLLEGRLQCRDTVSLQLKRLIPVNSLSSYMYTNPPGIMQAAPLSCLGPATVTFNPHAQSRDLIRHSNSSYECQTQYDQSRDNFPKIGLNTFYTAWQAHEAPGLGLFAALPPPLFMSPAKKEANASFCDFPSGELTPPGVVGSGVWYVCRSCHNVSQEKEGL